MAERIPILMQWLAETDVEAYLSGAGVSADSLDRLRHTMSDRPTAGQSADDLDKA